MPRKSTITLEEVILFVEENQIKNPTELAKLNKPYFNFIYRNRVTDKIPFLKKKILSPRDYEKEFRENRTKEWYDIERLLPYLERYAREEGTTVEEQCYIYYLIPEWEEFKKNHPNYPL